MPRPFLVFDMDGVLVDVTASYRDTIVQTLQHFTGAPITHEEIQDYKNQGGWNDDWQLSHHIITKRGVEVKFQEVVDHFQHIFHGNGTDGLILRERWMAREGLLERLAERFQLAVFTGRLCWEAELTLQRFAPGMVFKPIVGMDSVTHHKPHPEGLLRILEECSEAWYVGDTVDDARCAKAAGVPFVGIAAPGNPRYDDLVAALKGEGAKAVLDDINGLESVL
ncbi:MAG TPA: HAD-IA family hydrolase [Bryobacteraceae bacterium]|nr:HAD-IA family hydrolase [Bryobacteraceae bacterium]